VGALLCAEIIKDQTFAVSVSRQLKKETDKVIQFMDKLDRQPMDFEAYQEFWNRIMMYYYPHIQIKYVVDYLEPNILKELLPVFEEARVYAEPVFKRTEEFLITTAQHVAQINNWQTRMVLSLRQDEMEHVLQNGKLPPREEVEKRYCHAVIVSDKDGQDLLVENEAETIEKRLIKTNTNGMLKGSIAYIGKAKGTVRIILDPLQAEHFQEGDILVTGMTRPEYLPILKKAAAFVTDAGGILSHAAIVARELRKPCIIGTQHATKVFKDGDFVEVDADKGIIRLLL